MSSRSWLLVASLLLLAAGCLGSSDPTPQAGDGPEAGPDAQGDADRGEADPGPSDGEAEPVHASSNSSGGSPLEGAVRAVGERAFEPTIGVTPEGELAFAVLPESLQAPDPELPLVRRSPDDGATWTDATPTLADEASYPPSSGDPILHVDPDTGRTFLAQLQGLACSTLSYSDDTGRSWQHSPIPCGQPPAVQDHPTVFTGSPRALATEGYPNIVYQCVNRVADTACAVSLDGGRTFGPLRPLVYQTAAPTEPRNCDSRTGHGTTGPNGTVYLPSGRCGTPTVAVSTDDAITWDRRAIANATVAPDSQNPHEVRVATDGAGNVYATWIGEDRRPRFAASSDRGETWSDPIDVADERVGTADFPAVAAGGTGQAVLAYVATEARRPYDEMSTDDTWNAYLTVVQDATSDDPTLDTVAGNPPSDPIARGVCGGSRCAHPATQAAGARAGFDGGMGDFIDATIGPEGRPWAAVVDVCKGACVQGDAMREGAEGIAVTLAKGPSLHESGDRLDPLEP